MNDIVDNKSIRRFELKIGDDIVFADYSRDSDVLSVNFVFAPENLRGSGAASRLMQGIATIAQDEKLKIRPVCSYAASWLKRHPESARIA